MNKLIIIKLIGILLISSILLSCKGASPPIVGFSASLSNGTAPLTVQFTDQSTGEISEWAWDFDSDGVVDSTEQSPSYTYNTPGTYTVSLEVTGPGGADTETKAGYITVYELVVAVFSASPTSGELPLAVQFTDESTGGVTIWKWDFDSDGVVDSTEQSPSCTYDIAGTYAISLEVTGPGGSDTKTETGYIIVSSLSDEVTDMMKKIPSDIDEFAFFDIAALGTDNDLEVLYNDFVESLEDTLETFDIYFSDINYMAGTGEVSLLKGDFSLDDIREELEYYGFNDGEYRDAEVWELEDSCIALISSDLIIMGSEDDVKDCIWTINEGDDSLYDDTDIKDFADRLPNGIFVGIGTGDLMDEYYYHGLELWGISSKKKDKDTMTSTFVLKFDDEDDAEGAINDIEDDLEDSEDNYRNIRITQDGKCVKVIAEQDMENFIGEDEDQDAAARTERDNVQLAVVAAMADQEAYVLNPGYITNAPSNTVTYGNGSVLPIGDYIVGGLDSLLYSYHVDSDGLVTAISGPLAE